LAIHGRPAPSKSLAGAKGSARANRRVRCDEQRPCAARVQIRRIDNLLRLHAGYRNGERSSRLVLPVQGDQVKRLTRQEVTRKLMRVPKSEQRDLAFRKAIRQIPRGKVATYGQVAAAAGYPLYHRHVAALLRRGHGNLPWQRVIGAG